MIVFVNIIGWLMTEGLWVYLHATAQVPTIAEVNTFFERSYIGLVLGFTVADALWSNLFLLASIVGLWRMRSWGWTAALMANTIWIYTMTITLVRDLAVIVTAGMLFFLGFAVFALLSSIYLWQKRDLFWTHVDSYYGGNLCGGSTATNYLCLRNIAGCGVRLAGTPRRSAARRQQSLAILNNCSQTVVVAEWLGKAHPSAPNYLRSVQLPSVTMELVLINDEMNHFTNKHILFA